MKEQPTDPRRRCDPVSELVTRRHPNPVDLVRSNPETGHRGINCQRQLRAQPPAAWPPPRRHTSMKQPRTRDRDAFASDKLLLIGVQNSDASAYRLLPENLSYEPYAIVLPRGDWAFRLAVNRGLSQLYSSPDILEIYLKWFPAMGESHGLFRSAVYIFGTFPE